MPESVRCSRYEVDSARSFVRIKAHSTLHDIDGRGPISGFIEAAFFGDRLSTDAGIHAHLEIPVERLDSGNAAQDREMHQIIGSKSFPNIVADLVDAKPRPEANRYTVMGRIGVRGTTRLISGEIAMRQRDGLIELDGERSIDIRAFGIKPPRILVFQVNPEISILLHVVAKLSG